MDTESLSITAETTAIRARAWARLGIRLFGVIVLLVGAHNLLLSGMTETVLFGGYRAMADTIVLSDGGVVGFADVVAMAFGAALAWFL